MITQPLELQSRLSPPPRDLDFFAWVNIGLIALFFGLLGSRFVLAPGLAVGVGGESTLALPQIGGAMAGAGPASVVVSYRRDDVILFEGGMYNLRELRQHMEAYARKHPGAVMLVRADRQVSMQAFLNLCEMAREVGFANVLAAAEQSPAGAQP
jgi:biopolymer transport protein ExbD